MLPYEANRVTWAEGAAARCTESDRCIRTASLLQEDGVRGPRMETLEEAPIATHQKKTTDVIDSLWTTSARANRNPPGHGH